MVRSRALVLLVFILLITVFHYSTPSDNMVLHVLHYRINYIPIILAAFWFGLRGGLLASILCVTLYIPGIIRHVATMGVLGQALELVLYVIVGGITGYLVDQMNLQRQRALRIEKLATVGKMTSFVSHEIRNPLQAMRNIIALLSRRLSEKERETLELLKGEVERLELLVREFLLFTRIPKVNYKPIDWDKFKNRLIMSLSRPDQDRLLFETVTRETLLTDENLLHIILLNLIKNGLESTEEGKVTVKFEMNGQETRIKVQDEGPGLETKELEQIFDLFYSEKSYGTGLGLNLVKHAVSALEGKVEAYDLKRLDESGRRELGVGESRSGALFLVRLPCTEGKEQFRADSRSG